MNGCFPNTTPKELLWGGKLLAARSPPTCHFRAGDPVESTKAGYARKPTLSDCPDPDTGPDSHTLSITAVNRAGDAEGNKERLNVQ